MDATSRFFSPLADLAHVCSAGLLLRTADQYCGWLEGGGDRFDLPKKCTNLIIVDRVG